MSETIEMQRRYVASSDAMESRLGDRTVILHLKSGVYFGLDPIGSIIWDQLRAGSSTAAIIVQVRESARDVPESVGKDVVNFLSQLAENGLIRPE